MVPVKQGGFLLHVAKHAGGFFNQPGNEVVGFISARSSPKSADKEYGYLLHNKNDRYNNPENG